MVQAGRKRVAKSSPCNCDFKYVNASCCITPVLDICWHSWSWARCLAPQYMQALQCPRQPSGKLLASTPLSTGVEIFSMQVCLCRRPFGGICGRVPQTSDAIALPEGEDAWDQPRQQVCNGHLWIIQTSWYDASARRPITCIHHAVIAVHRPLESCVLVGSATS